MFEAAELGHSIDKETYDRRAPEVRQQLLSAQYEALRQARFPVIVVIGGVDGAGKGETVNLLNAWMDPRYVSTRAMGAMSEEERERPPFFRDWRALPPKGRTGIFFGSWHSSPIVERVFRRTTKAEMDQALERVVRFERMLTDEGALLFKFWFHLSKAQQEHRLRTLEQSRATRWRVTPTDWKHFAMYDRFRRVSEHALMRTSTGNAPWTVVEGVDARYRNLTVAEALLDGLRARLAGKDSTPKKAAAPLRMPIDGRTLLSAVAPDAKVDDKRYDKELEALQGRLNLATRHPRFQKGAVVVVFEGPDAAGKGGAIRRVTGALDARAYQVVPIAAPTDEERAQPYLWRFWRHVPRRGKLAIFDRSWYGRVLVERVEGLCSEPDWMRAYDEINEFEGQLAEHRISVVKFWLHIDRDEQLTRFERRQKTPFMRHKITEEDWRNRAKWTRYEVAASDMIDRTGVQSAPWTVVPANDKRHARLVVLRTLAERIEDAVARRRA